MSGYRTLCRVVFWLALTAWIGALAAAAVAASFTFTVLPGLDLTVAGYTLADAGEHGRLAAGKVMDPIFALVDLVQLVAAPLALLALGLELLAFRGPRRRWATAVQVVCLVAAAGLFAGRAALLTPSMNRNLRAYWAAAAAGDEQAAADHREAFDRDHPTASALFSGSATLLLVAVAAGAAATCVPTPRSLSAQGAR